MRLGVRVEGFLRVFCSAGEKSITWCTVKPLNGSASGYRVLGFRV